jgi:hypothetical protein
MDMDDAVSDHQLGVRINYSGSHTKVFEFGFVVAVYVTSRSSIQAPCQSSNPLLHWPVAISLIECKSGTSFHLSAIEMLRAICITEE